MFQYVNKSSRFTRASLKKIKQINNCNSPPYFCFVFGIYLYANHFQAVDDAGADKLTEDDKKLVRDKCQEALSWLDGNQLAEKDEFEHKLKELQQDCSPIMMKLHQNGASQGGATQGGKGPTVEEVD